MREGPRPSPKPPVPPEPGWATHSSGFAAPRPGNPGTPAPNSEPWDQVRGGERRCPVWPPVPTLSARDPDRPLCDSLTVGGRGPVVERRHLGLVRGPRSTVPVGGHELQERRGGQSACRPAQPRQGSRRRPGRALQRGLSPTRICVLSAILRKKEPEQNALKLAMILQFPF